MGWQTKWKPYCFVSTINSRAVEAHHCSVSPDTGRKKFQRKTDEKSINKKDLNHLKRKLVCYLLLQYFSVCSLWVTKVDEFIEQLVDYDKVVPDTLLLHIFEVVLENLKNQSTTIIYCTNYFI